MANKVLKDKDYDIISVVYNASQALEVCEQYSRDAEREGDQEAKQFFSQVQETNSQLVQKGKDLLKSRL